MAAAEFRKSVAAAATTDANKLEAIRNVLRTYFEVDPWTGAETGLYDEDLTAQDAIDMIVEILK